MSLLVDANILSEVLRPKPDQRVVDFLANTPVSEQFLSVLTIGEIRFGVESLPAGKRRDRLQIWLENDLLVTMAGQILPLTLEVAEHWALLKAQAGRTLPAIDSLIAATALHHDFDLVTRNTKDFANLGLRLVDPFAAVP